MTTEAGFYEEEDITIGTGYYKVTFLVKATNKKLTKRFPTRSSALRFVNKLDHSKKAIAIAYPL